MDSSAGTCGRGGASPVPLTAILLQPRVKHVMDSEPIAQLLTLPGKEGEEGRLGLLAVEDKLLILVLMMVWPIRAQPPMPPNSPVTRLATP